MTTTRKLARFLLVTTSLCMPALAAAQVVAGDNKTQVYTAPNGVTVVDIAKANASGLSHNRFDQYNVPATGVVLNNGNRDEVVRQSQLAGAVTANLNLDKSARVILNEVTGANRAILTGYTEVLGSAADVLVANPYGITCDGCGFINAPNVTLTTGKPKLDASGALTGFAVTTGDIFITGRGLNASAQDYLALVARSVRIDAQVNAKALDVVAGVDGWDSTNREVVVTARTGTGPAPEYAIDSTAFGGIYAGRIRLIATEAGVGVRALGDVAASGADFTLDAAGKVVLAGRISAANDVRLATTGTGITLQQASITATRDLAVQAGGGAVVVTGGTLVAGRDLALSGASLADDAVASTGTDANRRAATGALALAFTGDASIGGVSYGGASTSIGAGSLTASGATLYSGAGLSVNSAGALSLGDSSVHAVSGMMLTAQGLLSTAAGAKQGVVADAGNVVVTAAGTDNRGTISADAGALTLISTGTIANGGTLHAATSLVIGAAAGGTVDLSNDGTLLGDGTAALTIGTLSNTGTLQSNGVGSITATAVTNDGTIALGARSGTGTIATASLTNRQGGTVQSVGTLTLDGLATLDNAGTLLSGDAVTLTGQGVLTNQASGIVQAVSALTINGAALTNSGTMTANGVELTLGSLDNGGSLLSRSDIGVSASMVANAGKLVADGATALDIDTLVSTGTIQAGTDLTATLGTSLDNGGSLIAGAGLSVSARAADAGYRVTNRAGAYVQSTGALSILGAGTIDNAGTLIGGATLDIATRDFTNTADGRIRGTGATSLTAGGALVNGGLLIAGFDPDAGGTILAEQVTNSGKLQSAGTLALSIADQFDNAGQLLASDGIAIAARDAARVLTVSNRAGASIQTLGALTLAGTAGGHNLTVAAQQGNLLADSAVLTIGGLDNGGVVQTTGALRIDSDATIANTGTLLGQSSLTLDARTITNDGILQGNSGAALTVNSLNNRGTLIGSTAAGGTLAITGLAVTNSGTAQSAGAVTLAVRDMLDNRGKLIAGRSLAIQSSDAGHVLQLSNGSTATMQAGGSLVIGDGSRTVRIGTLGGYLLAGNAALTLHGDVSSNAWIQTDAAASIDDDGAFDNRGTVYAKDSLTIVATAIVNRAIAQLQGTRGATLNSTGVVRNDGTMSFGLDAGRDGSITAQAVRNTGTIQSSGDLRIVTHEGVDNGGVLYADRAMKLMAMAATDSLAIYDRNGATIQSGGLLTIGSTGSNVALTIDDARVLADRIDMRGTSVTNAGAIQTNDDASFRLTGAFANTKTLLAQGRLTIQAGQLNNSQSAQIEAVRGSTVTAAGLNNQGDIYLASKEGADATLHVATLVNGGTILGNGDVGLTVDTSIDNSKNLAAAGDLVLRAGAGPLSISNASTGMFQADGTLSIADSAGGTVAFTRQDGTLWGGTSLALAMATLTNTGTLRSDADATLTFSGTFTNSTGKTFFATGGSGTATITAARIDNASLLQSQGGLVLKVGTAGLVNSSTVSATGDLMISGTGTSFSVGGGGRFQSSGGAVSITGAGASVTLGLGSIIYGRTVDLDVGTVTLNGNSDQSVSGGSITAEGDLTLNTTALNINASNAAIVGNVRASENGGALGLTTITTSGALANPGFIFSGARLAVTATGIINMFGGGINALGDTTLTSRYADFQNSGDIYTAGGLAITALGYAITNDNAITSDGSISFDTGVFSNRSRIASKGDITVSAGVFENTIGNDPRTLATAPTDQQDMPEDRHNYYSGWESDSPGDVAVENMQGGSHTEGDTRYYHSGTYTVEDTFNVDRASIVRPSMVADGTLAIVDFGSAKNFGGILSGHTFRLVGAGTTSTFVNDAVVLNTYTHSVSYQDYDDCNGAVNLDCVLHPKLGYTDALTSTVAKSGNDGSIGASIYAVDMDVQAFAVTNTGNPFSAAGGSSRTASGSAAPSATVAGIGATIGAVRTTNGANKANGATGVGGVAGAGASSLIGGADLNDIAAVQATVAAAGVGGATTVQGQPAIAYQGVVITLPQGINGQYVVSRDPSSSYLVETNPRFGLEGAVGSDFIAQRLGINVDLLARRLGDASYEAFLISQQVQAQLGTAKIAQAETFDQQVQSLMVNGVAAADTLGLTYGEALTSDQVAKLDTDMVWMVETEVAGQTVLAPVVYISAKTRAMFDSGDATMQATNAATFNVGTLTNTGGTIGGTNALTVNATGDITNTSGTITGGTVSLTSTTGSVINQTYSATTGAAGNQATAIGKQAGIVATGGLKIDAAKDIKVTGATVSAGADASLKAGNAITFDTVDDVNSTSSRSKDHYSETTTTTQHGSTLNVGGNLSLDSGGDTTFKASDANVAGNADVKTGGDFNIIAGQNSTAVHDESATSGAGVGGGVYGTSTTTTDEFHGRNVASGFNVGGNATIDATGAMNVQGSNVNVAGNASVNAGSVNILQGNNVDTRTSTTSTTTYLRTGSGTKSGAGADADADASAGGWSAQAGAGAGAGAYNKNQGNLELMNNTKTTTTNESSRAVGSSFNVGGNADIKAKNDVTLQGSELNAGGNVEVDAKNINLLAAENKQTSTTTTNSTSVGFMVDNKNTADANADASASASFTAQASAEAKAGVETDSTVDLVRNTQTTTGTTDITHTGSSIKSGGNTSLTAKDQLTVAGSSVDAAGDVDLKAKDMTFKAVDDVHETTTSTQQTGVGLYANGNAEAKAGGVAGVTGGTVGASAGAEASYGVNVSRTSSENTEGSTTAQTSSIKSGGNMTRTADGKITDVGTTIDAGGDFTQSATTWDSKAAANTTYSSSKDQSDNARIGQYVDAEAGASAGASIGNGAKSGADADASVGVKATYEHEGSSSTDNSSTARVSTIKSGGKFTSTTTDNTSLEGTKIDAGGDASLTAGSLDYTAAHNTHSSTSQESNGSAEVKAGISASKAVKAEGSASYDGSEAKSQSSTAVVGGMTSGGNLSITTTKGDANLEGTNLKAAGSGSIESAGSVNYTAARDTASSSSTSQDAAASVSLSKGGGEKSGGVEVGGGFEHKDSDSDTARVGSFQTGGDMSIHATKDATIEGTNLKADGNGSVTAGGNIDMKAAESTSSTHAYGAQLTVSGEASKKDAPAAKPAKTDAPGDGAAAKPAKGSDGKDDAGNWNSAKPSKSAGDEGSAPPSGGKKPDAESPTKSATPSSSPDSKSNTEAPKAAPTETGKSGNDADQGSQPKPVIGQRGQPAEPTSTTSESPKSTSTDAGKGSSDVKEPTQPKPVIGQRGQSGDAAPSSTDVKKTDGKASEPAKEAPAKPTPADKPADAKKPADATSDPATPSDPAKPQGWVKAKPGVTAPEAPKPEEKPEGTKDDKAPKWEKSVGVDAGADYQSTDKTIYTGSTVETGGTLTVQAGGDVNRENVTTNAQGGTTTTAGGTVSDTKKDDSSTQKAGGASLQVKKASADTATGTADNAGDVSPQ